MFFLNYCSAGTALNTPGSKKMNMQGMLSNGQLDFPRPLKTEILPLKKVILSSVPYILLVTDLFLS